MRKPNRFADVAPPARYRGRWNERGVPLVTVEDPCGRTLRVLAHVLRHSPDGFAWGYHGSGPADLARSLLIDALGDDARCATCAGTRACTWDTTLQRNVPSRTVPHRLADRYRCPDCQDGHSALVGRLYHAFEREVIAELPQQQSWTLTVDEIRTWVAIALDHETRA